MWLCCSFTSLSVVDNNESDCLRWYSLVIFSFHSVCYAEKGPRLLHPMTTRVPKITYKQNSMYCHGPWNSITGYGSSTDYASSNNSRHAWNCARTLSNVVDVMMCNFSLSCSAYSFHYLNMDGPKIFGLYVYYIENLMCKTNLVYQICNEIAVS